jgi:activating signal cointegrator complex subunit 2
MTPKLPPIAVVPPLHLRIQLAPEEWVGCLNAWIALSQYYLRLPPADFEKGFRDKTPVLPFLTSFYYEASLVHGNAQQSRALEDKSLRQAVFLLTHRVYMTVEPVPVELIQYDFLANFSTVEASNSALRSLLSAVWEKKSEHITGEIQKLKLQWIRDLESPKTKPQESMFRKLTYLIDALPAIGHFLMTGSDFLDSLNGFYPTSQDPTRSYIVALVFTSLISLMRGIEPNYSLLLDQLYSIKTQTKNINESLIADLVTNTPVLERLQEACPANEGPRVQKVVDALKSYRIPVLERPRRIFGKGKDKVTDDSNTSFNSSDIHVHKMSKVSQIHDLFPDLGGAFIMKLLDAYEDDVERVTASLLDNTLPDHLKNADRTEQMYVPSTMHGWKNCTNQNLKLKTRNSSTRASTSLFTTFNASSRAKKYI